MFKAGLDKILLDANQVIIDNDRDLYKDYLRVIEESIGERGQKEGGGGEQGGREEGEREAVITGYNAIRLIKSGDVDKDSYVFELYTEDPYEFSLSLSHKLLSEVKSPHIPKETIALITKIRRKELEIQVFGRVICKVYAFAKMDNVQHLSFSSSFANNYQVKVCNPLILLIKLYKQIKIADPCPDFDKLKQNESDLVEYLRNKTSGGSEKQLEANINKQDEKTGEREDIGDKEGGFYAGGSFNIAQHASELLNFVRKGKYEYAVIGDYAWKDSNRGRLQLIMTDINEFFNDFAKQHPRDKYKLNYISINLPDEWVMKKCSIFLESGEQSVVIADIFNNAEFELIPLQSTQQQSKQQQQYNYNRAEFITIAKMYLIEIWILTTYMAGPKAPNLSRKIDDLYDSFYKVRGKYIGSEFDDYLLSHTNFIGNYANEAVQKRNIIKERNDFIPPYYPANYNDGTKI